MPGWLDVGEGHLVDLNRQVAAAVPKITLTRGP